MAHTPKPQREKSGPKLDGCTVLLTRPLEQCRDMAQLLERHGAAVICAPMIQTVPPLSWAEFDSAQGRLAAYDWIVFTSANAVAFFATRMSELKRMSGAPLGSNHTAGGPDSESLGSDAAGSNIVAIADTGFPKCCAIGAATAAALRKRGMPVDLIAADSRAEGVLSAVARAAGGKGKLKGLKFLMPRAEAGREFLPLALRALGAEIDAPPVYRTIAPASAKDVAGILAANRIDAVAFTSPSAVNNLAQALGHDRLDRVLAGVVIACIGPTTAAAARRHGLERIVQSAQASAASLGRAIVRAIGRREAVE